MERDYIIIIIFIIVIIIITIIIIIIIDIIFDLSVVSFTASGRQGRSWLSKPSLIDFFPSRSAESTC